MHRYESKCNNEINTAPVFLTSNHVMNTYEGHATKLSPSVLRATNLYNFYCEKSFKFGVT